MNFWVNLSIILIIIAFIGFFFTLRMLQAKKLVVKDDEMDERANYTFAALTSFIKKRMTEITTANLYNENLTEEEFKRRTRRRQELKDALKMCNTGDLSSKTYIREYISDLLCNEYGVNEENINWTIPFDHPDQMTAREKFETLLHLSVKKHGDNGFGYLVDTFKLAEPKQDGSYRIQESDINLMYKQIVRGRALQFADKLAVVTQILYSHYKGFGIIDELRDMAIDGVSGGLSGHSKKMANYMSDLEFLQQAANKGNHGGLNSAWCMYQGKTIHLEFLYFEHEAELRRVVNNVYKYNSPGQLSETRPFIINEMYDGSRTTVIRPKLAESWAFFIRKKYSAQAMELTELITAQNNELPIGVLEYLMKGYRTAAITGAQGSGKTTLLLALIKHVHPALNLRVQETSFEANLRSLYPNRNILSFQETETVSGQDGLDLQKKTDGDVTILGEVATDPVAAWMIQSAQVASLFTIFTHHAKTFTNLVHALRNSLLKVGMFSNEAIAEQQVVNVLEFDIHVDFDVDGTRYIERITECIPIEYEDEGVSMHAIANAKTKDDKVEALIQVASTYFRQQTQRKFFIERTIVEYRDGAYIAVEPISEKRQAEIMRKLSPQDRQAFREFIEKNWGEAS